VNALNNALVQTNRITNAYLSFLNIDGARLQISPTIQSTRSLFDLWFKHPNHFKSF